MLGYVYKSLKKEQTYLYLLKRDDFSPIPDSLLEVFGEAQLVMPVDFDRRSSLAGAEIGKVKEQLLEQGFYLQLPPPPENYLEQFKTRK